MNSQRTFIATLSRFAALAALLLTTLVASQSLHATEACDQYKEEIAYYENLRRNGGKAEEMDRWRAIGNELEDKYYRCKKDNEGGIQTTSGDKPEPTSAPVKEHKPLRRTSLNDDEQLQRLTKTCNYWIETNNENPTQDNSNFRDTACRAVDNYGNGQANSPASNSPAPNSQADAMPVRKLKDCIKPHNLIDQEVNECVKGNIEPTWKIR